MHIVVREERGLDELDQAVDLGHSPADLVCLSFSDSELAALAAAHDGGQARPSLRLASLARLRHPLSVDLYLDQVMAHAKAVLVRLLGGLDYWRYGAEELSALCRRRGIALALLPGDGPGDARLAALSTVTADALDRLDRACRAGGPDAMALVLDLLHQAAGGPVVAPERHAAPLPEAGIHRFPDPGNPDSPFPDRADAVIVFYRSHLAARDIAPIEALAAAVQARGLGVAGLYVASLKAPAAAALVAEALVRLKPSVVLNATGFSARQAERASPLDAAGVPVLQLVMAGSDEAAWAASPRGLTQADLAMQMVLPELDGRLDAGVISFKAALPETPGLEFSRIVHRPDPAGVAAAADRAAAWVRLARTAPAGRRLAVVLSDYPGVGGQVAHAVGLDSFASLAAILGLLDRAGYRLGPVPDAARLVDALTSRPATALVPLAQYRAAFATLPPALQHAVTAAWGAPEDDPAVADGHFALRHLVLGNCLLAVQPDRGRSAERKADYHDPDRPPRHGYVAFYLWLRQAWAIDALVHLGTHGTLEWLPGKAVALSPGCAPRALLGPVPVIYPFIVNNPGEAAVAKRRLGAVTIGHQTPPLRAAGSHPGHGELERLIDEFAAADGLDRRRTALLRREILDRAAATGLLAESGVAPGSAEDDALARLDAYLCDVKDLQIRDGLHVFGEAPQGDARAAHIATLGAADPGRMPDELAALLDASAAGERGNLLAALDGRFVPPGPAGAPSRGRLDVLPSGRNLFAIDPRAIPSRSAVVLAEQAAAALIRRHLQDQGDWPRRLVLDLWGSSTLRTGGEDLALALILMGARPLWDHGSARVTGVEILTLAQLDRPRVDVTLRISGLFRDAFETQIALFDAAVEAVARRDEAPEWNSLAGAAAGLEGAAFRRATRRIWGGAPGHYGTGVADPLESGRWSTAAELGEAYLAASSHAYGRAPATSDPAGFAALVAAAELFVHGQDMAESDLLDGIDNAAHEGGFAAAAQALGGTPALYRTDSSRPERVVVRSLEQDLRRVVRGRLANPGWLAGMTRHGYRGAAEIARGVEGLYGFAATTALRLDSQFDLVFDATLGDEAMDRFLAEANPQARAQIAGRFAEAIRRGLWQPRRNAVAAILHETAP